MQLGGIRRPGIFLFTKCTKRVRQSNFPHRYLHAVTINLARALLFSLEFDDLLNLEI